MNDIAIASFFYSRPDSSKRLLNQLLSLKQERGFVYYLFVDRASDNASQEVKHRNAEVIELVSKCAIQLQANLIVRDLNFGLSKSLLDGINEVFIKHEKVVVFEDDISLAPHALSYFKNALEKYESNQTIYGIAGNSFADKKAQNHLPEAYLLPIATSWGWATWKQKWFDFTNLESQVLFDQVAEKGFDRFNFGGYPYKRLFEKLLAKEVNSWAILYYAQLYLKDGLFLFPKHPVSENFGFNKDATHSKSQNTFAQNANGNALLPILPKEIELDENVLQTMKEAFARNLSKHHANSSQRQFKALIKKILK